MAWHSFGALASPHFALDRVKPCAAPSVAAAVQPSYLLGWYRYRALASALAAEAELRERRVDARRRVADVFSPRRRGLLVITTTPCNISLCRVVRSVQRGL